MKRKPSTTEETALPTVSAMRLRAYPNSGQISRVGHWLYITHTFREQAVAFITQRRRTRAAWLHHHPHLYAYDGLPEELIGSDADACSRWLTETLARSRKAAQLEFGLSSNLRTLPQQLSVSWNALTRDERDERMAFYESQGMFLTWCLLPRTILDQTIRDFDKTIQKAIADRKENKRRKAQGKKPLKAAGFPKSQKWTYANSVRFQINAAKNQDVRIAWQSGELYIPGVGRLKLRENGYMWPSTPPSLITLARSSGNTWHVSFVCKYGEGKSARSRRLEAEGRVWERLPTDERGRPAIEDWASFTMTLHTKD